MERRRKIKIAADGPYLVEGGIPLIHENVVLGADGEPESWLKGDAVEAGERYALCRCGGSGRPPFCDGSHLTNGFQGQETSPLTTPVEAEDITSGEGIELVDVPCRCSIARFCHRNGDAWSLTEESADPDKKKVAIESALNCPSGRLSIRDKIDHRDIDAEAEPEIGLIHDAYHGGEGPLWIRGGIEIESAGGKVYEKRNRVTLCRCGNSKNKPLCDGSHVKMRFGRPSLK